MPHWSIVDLGTKKGGAIGVVRRRFSGAFKRKEPPRNLCLGVDRFDDHKRTVEKAGFQHMVATIGGEDETFTWPPGDVYVASNFLEHLKDIPQAIDVLTRMLVTARVGVWLRLPSFEPDTEVKKAGLQFYWETWACHRAHFCLSHMHESIARARESRGSAFDIAIDVKPITPVDSTSHKSLVPFGSPENVGYESKFGEKPKHRFRFPVPGGYDVAIKF